MDARQRRSQTKLFAAILELADGSRVEELTVTQVASQAGVHRSTFYEHADSPATLLRAALQLELDDARQRYLSHVSNDSLPAAIRDVTLAVLVHVQQHAGIYRRGLADGGTLHDFLSGHFQESARLLVEQGFLEPPTVPGVAHEMLVDASSRYVADGTVGAIAVWLENPGSPTDFLSVVTELLPRWWQVEP